MRVELGKKIKEGGLVCRTFGSKKFWVKKILGSKKFWVKKLLGQKTFRSIYSVPNPLQLVGKNRAGFLNQKF